MRKIAKQREEEGAEIDLTPMLDVVFIMLIFFIVVASFLKEAGLEINRPDDNQPQDPNDSVSIVVEIASDNQLWMENRRVDVRAVRANIQRLLAEDPDRPQFFAMWVSEFAVCGGPTPRRSCASSQLSEALAMMPT